MGSIRPGPGESGIARDPDPGAGAQVHLHVRQLSARSRSPRASRVRLLRDHRPRRRAGHRTRACRIGPAADGGRAGRGSLPCERRRPLCREPRAPHRVPGAGADRRVPRLLVPRAGAPGRPAAVGPVSRARGGAGVPGHQPEVETLPPGRRGEAARRDGRERAGKRRGTAEAARLRYSWSASFRTSAPSAPTARANCSTAGAIGSTVGEAPLRETLAAAMLLESGWDGRAPLADPFCGSGTIPIEAALLARRMAPGLHRGFAFERWPELDALGWKRVKESARARVLAPCAGPHRRHRPRRAARSPRRGTTPSGPAWRATWSSAARDDGGVRAAGRRGAHRHQPAVRRSGRRTGEAAGALRAVRRDRADPRPRLARHHALAAGGSWSTRPGCISSPGCSRRTAGSGCGW